MKLPRPRFTVRRLMVAVAVVAVIAAAVAEGERRRARFRELYQRYTVEGLNYSVIDFGGTDPEKRADYIRATKARNAKPWAYYADMARKYKFAARYPWLPVAPDPPEPK